jgi:hypothetical protein
MKNGQGKLAMRTELRIRIWLQIAENLKMEKEGKKIAA